MATIAAGLTVSVDGYFVGPDDGPGRGLGLAAARLPRLTDESPGGSESVRVTDLPRRTS